MPRKRSIQITCPKCEGTGEATLTGVLAETYLLLAAQKEPVNALELSRRSPGNVSGATMNDRLRRMEELGIAMSVPTETRQRLWCAVT